MTALGSQRWRERKTVFRRPDEQIDPRRYDVVPLANDATARAFVERHHYSGTYPAARFRFGLYDAEGLAGVAVFSHPASDAVLTKVFPGHRATDAVELGRLVLLDQVPGNGESWFVARAFEALRGEGIAGVVSFSDDVPRVTAAGESVFPGHIGTVYQALNAKYQGRGTPRTLHLLPDGRVFSARTAQKIRRQERGWRYAVEQLVAAGARPLAGDPAAWLRSELPRVTRRLRHPGNHKYAWGLSRREMRALRTALPFPKRTVVELRRAA